MKLTAHADVQLEQIQQVLRMDAAFTADVLRLANSPLIGMRGEIKSVMQAVMMLGLERIKALSTTLSMRAFLTSAGSTDALLASWRHNLATAILCERLGRILVIDIDSTDPKTHDLGILNRKMPEATGAGDDDPLACLRLGLLDSLVGGDAGAD